MQRGEVYWANLRPRSGSEQAGRRPVIIVSNDGFNSVSSWNSIIIIPMTTSSRQGVRSQTVVNIPANSTSLQNDSYAICHQITTLDRSKIDDSDCLGMLSSDLISQIEEGIKAALDIPS